MDRIEKAGGHVTPDGRVNGGLNLSRALGDHAYKTNGSLTLQDQMISPVPDIKTLDLDPKLDSYVFLACDGIWNSLSSQEVVDFINERLTGDKEETPEHLKTVCIEVILAASLTIPVGVKSPSRSFAFLELNAILSV
jgi:protein phosphatase 1G